MGAFELIGGSRNILVLPTAQRFSSTSFMIHVPPSPAQAYCTAGLWITRRIWLHHHKARGLKQASKPMEPFSKAYSATPGERPLSLLQSLEELVGVFFTFGLLHQIRFFIRFAKHEEL